MAGDYLVSAANDMYRIASVDKEPTPAQVEELAARGGEALKRAQDDRTLRESVRELGRARRQYAEAFQATLGAYGDSRGQLERFLEQERAVLLTAGLEPELIEELITQGREYVGRAREWEGDGDRIFAQVALLQDRALGLAAQLKEAQLIAKALAQAAERNDRLASQLERAQATHQAAMQDLAVARDENHHLASQLADARRTNQNLTDQLAHTGPLGAQRGRARIFWRLTYGVGGLVVIMANTAAMPLIGPPASAASGAIGGSLVGVAINNQ